jgi:hypothetical protein
MADGRRPRRFLNRPSRCVAALSREQPSPHIAVEPFVGVPAMGLFGLTPFATVSAMYVLGFAGIMIVAWDAATGGDAE